LLNNAAFTHPEVGCKYELVGPPPFPDMHSGSTGDDGQSLLLRGLDHPLYHIAHEQKAPLPVLNLSSRTGVAFLRRPNF
jgi:hypothetical protein